MNDTFDEEDENDDREDWYEIIPALVYSNSGAWFDNQFQSRMEIVSEVYERRLVSSERWWTLLGDMWTQCDNVGRYAEWLKPKFRRASRLRLRMMKKADRTVYDTLPETLTGLPRLFSERRARNVLDLR